MELIGTDAHGRFVVYYDSYCRKFHITEKRKNETTKIQLHGDGSKTFEDAENLISTPPKDSIMDVTILKSKKIKSNKLAIALREIHELMKKEFIINYPYFKIIFEDILEYCENPEDEKHIINMLKSYINIHFSAELQQQFGIDKILKRIEPEI